MSCSSQSEKQNKTKKYNDFAVKVAVVLITSVTTAVLSLNHWAAENSWISLILNQATEFKQGSM